MVETPGSLRELVDVVRSSAVGGEALLFEGGGTKRGWLREGLESGLTVSTSKLEGVVEHEHGDMTATVRAGTRIVDLQAALAERGQRLAIDAPLGDEDAATLGGVFSADDAGPGRLAFGSLRELTIGGTFVLSDGTVARSGGKVIKNVAGYDLCKLFCGARGTLGMVAELTLRLHPVSPAEVTLRVEGLSSELAKLALGLASGRLTPTALTVQGGGLDVRFEGAEPFVAAQAKLAAAVLTEAGLEPRRLEDDESRGHWRFHAEARRAAAGEVRAVSALLPTEIPGYLRAAEAELQAQGLEARLTADPRLGAVNLCLGAASIAEHAECVRRLRTLAEAKKGSLRLRERPQTLDAHIDPFGELPSGLGVMSALKSQLDPVGRCMPGRYFLPV